MMIDNDPIAHTGQLVFVAHPACQIDICCILRPQAPLHDIFSNDPQKTTSHINRQLTIALCTLCICALAVRTLSVLFRLSVSCESKGAPGTTQSRGRRNGTISAPALLKNHLDAQDHALAHTNGSEASGRGKQSSVKDCAPAAISHTVEVQAQTIPSSNTHLSSTTPEPEVSKIAASRRGLSNPVHQTSPPIVHGTWPGLLQASYYPIAYFLGRFTSVVLAEFLWPSTGFSSYGRIPRVPTRNRLLRSLYGRRPTLFLLVVAVDDAVRDLWVLDHALSVLKSESIRFTGLGGLITLEDIDLELKKLCEESKEFPDSQIVVLLTGHGGECNKMLLPRSESVDAPHLFKLLESHHVRNTPVTILFDVCRPGGSSGPEPPEGISLIWTCFPNEAAGAYRLPHGPDSIFLTALMMASRESPGRISEPPQDAIQIQLDFMTEYLKKRYVISHSNRICRWCRLNCCYEPTAQNIDWEYARNTDGLLTLMENLSDTEVADGVYRWFREDYLFCIANNLPIPKALWDHLWDRI